MLSTRTFEKLVLLTSGVWSTPFILKDASGAPEPLVTTLLALSVAVTLNDKSRDASLTNISR